MEHGFVVTASGETRTTQQRLRLELLSVNIHNFPKLVFISIALDFASVT